MDWEKTDNRFKKIAEKHLYNAVVKVVQYEEDEYVSDDLFRTPQYISSGVYSIPCFFDYSMRTSYNMLPGGVTADSEAYLETGDEWYSTFNKDKSYIEYNSMEYDITKVDSSIIGGTIIVQLKRRK